MLWIYGHYKCLIISVWEIGPRTELQSHCYTLRFDEKMWDVKQITLNAPPLPLFSWSRPFDIAQSPQLTGHSHLAKSPHYL